MLKWMNQALYSSQYVALEPERWGCQFIQMCPSQALHHQ